MTTSLASSVILSPRLTWSPPRSQSTSTPASTATGCMNQDELVEYMRKQIEVAARLGFPIARVQISLTPDAMESLLPVAEKYGVTLALEVHADQHGAHERVLALRDRYEKLDSPLLGFTAGLGCHRYRLCALPAGGLPPPWGVGGTSRTGGRPVERVLRRRTAKHAKGSR